LYQEAIDGLDLDLVLVARITQDALDTLTGNIKAAVALLMDFVPADDFTAYDLALASVPDNAKENDYTSASWALFKADIDGLDLTLEEGDRITQDDLDSLTEEIEDAVALLVERADDFTDYDDAVASVPSDTDKLNYTTASWTLFKYAIYGISLALSPGSDISQADLDIISGEIEYAVALLVLHIVLSSFTTYDLAVDFVPADANNNTDICWALFNNAIADFDLTLTTGADISQTDMDTMMGEIEN